MEKKRELKVFESRQSYQIRKSNHINRAAYVTVFLPIAAGEEEVQEYEVTVEGDGDLAEVRRNPTFEVLNAFQGRGIPRQPQSH